MPRHARLDTTGALHHIMVRGINKGALFQDDLDRTKFRDRLGTCIVETRCSVYAWVLMDNHVHLLVRSGAKGVSTLMRKLLTWYAVYYNRRHHRSGHLFENRYKSVLCQEDQYFLALVRYIHLNPVRAGMVTQPRELATYPWSGHAALAGKERYTWMDTAHVLLQFAPTEQRARNAYRRFVEEGFSMGHVPELTGGGLIRSLGGWSEVVSMRRKGGQVKTDGRILGTGDFVNAVLKEAADRHLRQLRIRNSDKTVAAIIEEECARNGIATNELASGSRRNKVSRARAAIAFRCVRELGTPAAEIARYVGVNTSSVSRAIARMEEGGKS
jgi:putative transposase